MFSLCSHLVSFHVVFANSIQLLSKATDATPAQHADAWAHVGALYAARHNWSKAVAAFVRAGKPLDAANAAIELEEFGGVADLVVKAMPEGVAGLEEIARRYATNTFVI